MKLLVSVPWVNAFLDDFRNAFPQVELVMPTERAELLAQAADAEVIFGPVDQELLLAAPKVRWIQSGSAGVEWMREVPALAESAVTVTNTRGAHASTIAEHTFGMLVSLARRFPTLYTAQQKRRWEGEMGRDSVGLAGLTMGIVGLGRIGRAIASRAHAFEMKVSAVDVHPVEKPDYVAELGLLDRLPALLQSSDVVVVATPITDQTRGMLGPAQLALLQPSAFLLVISRGGIIDEPTLVRMLREGKLAGAGLDVAATEPLPVESELWDAPNLLITPHCSPTSRQTHANIVAILRENLAYYLAGRPLLNVVDKRLGY